MEGGERVRRMGVEGGEGEGEGGGEERWGGRGGVGGREREGDSGVGGGDVGGWCGGEVGVGLAVSNFSSKSSIFFLNSTIFFSHLSNSLSSFFPLSFSSFSSPIFKLNKP